MTTTESSLIVEIRKQQSYLKSIFGERVIILTEVGDFYQAYGQDAIALSGITNYKLSKRDGSARDSLQMCGFPSERGGLDSVLEKILEKGYVVGLFNQESTIDERGKIIITRKLENILTQGTYFDSKNPTTLFIKGNEAIFSETFSQQESAFTYKSIEEIYEIVSIFNPGEIIVCNDLDLFYKLEYSLNNPIFTYLDKGSIRETYQNYLKLTIGGALVNKTDTSQGKMNISLKTLKNLMIFGDRNETSVFSVIDKTETAFGRRTLKNMLRSPLLDKSLIKDRYNIIDEILKSNIIEPISENLRRMIDFEVFLTKLVSNRFTIDDIVAFKNSVDSSIKLLSEKQFLNVISLTSNSFKDELTDFNGISVIIGELRSTKTFIENLVSEDYFNNYATGPTFLKYGNNKDVDTASDITIKKSDVFEKEELRIKNVFNIDGRIKEDKSGKLLFQTKVSPKKLEAPFVWITTLKSGDRYTYKELLQMENVMSQSKEVISGHEGRNLEEIRISILFIQISLLNLTKLLSFLDVYIGFACLVRSYGFIIPVVSEGNQIDMKDMKHVVVASRMFGEEYIANDIHFDKNTKGYYLSFMNGGGKSTFLRGAGITMILFQIGCPVMCSKATLSPVDGIFARIGGGDNLLNKESTFVLEMKELKEICEKATCNSLVLLDEIGRGTDNKSGLAIAKATMIFFSKLNSNFVFSSHYHELSEIVNTTPTIKSLVVEEIYDENKELTFSYKMKPGISDTSHGYEVARIVGLPDDIMNIAKDFL